MAIKNFIFKISIVTLSFLLFVSAFAPNIMLANSTEFDEDEYNEISTEDMLTAYWGEDAQVTIISDSNGELIYTVVQEGILYEYHEYDESTEDEMRTKSLTYKYVDEEKILIDDYIEELTFSEELIIINTEDVNGDTEHIEIDLTKDEPAMGEEEVFNSGGSSSDFGIQSAATRVETGGSYLSNIRFERFSDGRARAWFQTGSNAKWTRSTNQNYRNFRDHARDLGNMDKNIYTLGVASVISEIVSMARTRTITFTNMKNILKRMFVPASAIIAVWNYYSTAKDAWTHFRRI